jgi:hypothetical protein
MRDALSFCLVVSEQLVPVMIDDTSDNIDLVRVQVCDQVFTVRSQIYQLFLLYLIWVLKVAGLFWLGYLRDFIKPDVNGPILTVLMCHDSF